MKGSDLLFGVITSQEMDDMSSGVPVVMLRVHDAVYWWEVEDNASSQSSNLLPFHSLKMTIPLSRYPEEENDMSVYLVWFIKVYRAADSTDNKNTFVLYSLFDCLNGTNVTFRQCVSILLFIFSTL